jgi:hypothetical protein
VPIVKKIGSGWDWFEDYAYSYSIYTVNCPPDRLCQVGMGIFAFGGPRGEKVRFSGAVKIVTIGVGSIHVRVDDQKGPCVVRVDQGDVGLIKIIDEKF